MDVLPVCMPGTQRTEKGIGCPGNRIKAIVWVLILDPGFFERATSNYNHVPSLYFLNVFYSMAYGRNCIEE